MKLDADLDMGVEEEYLNDSDMDVYENTVYLNTLLKQEASILYTKLSGFRNNWMHNLVVHVCIQFIILFFVLLLWETWDISIDIAWFYFCSFLLFISGLSISNAYLSFKKERYLDRFLDSFKESFSKEDHDKFINSVANNLFVKNTRIGREDLKNMLEYPLSKNAAITKNLLIGSLKIFITEYLKYKKKQQNV